MKKCNMQTAYEQLLDGLDWLTYEDNVVNAMLEAVEKYCRIYSSGLEDKVFQVSIWTDAQGRVTAINFETHQHARDNIRSMVDYWRERGDEESAKESERLEYEGNPAGFKYPEFVKVSHPELDVLKRLNYRDPAQAHAADAHIEASLLRVRDRILEAKILDKLPREPEIWFGISSPQDWYDHAMKVQSASRS